MSEYNNGVVDEHAGYEEGEDRRANISKVRDILFGSQTKSNEARFARLEEGMAREIFEMKDLLRRRTESLESFFHSETLALAEHIRQEREERLSAFEAHDLEMKGALTALSRRLGEMSIAVNEGDSSVRRDLMNESRKLLDEITHKHESVRGLMESRVSELHSRKADRAVISDLMREMASQLEKDHADGAE